MNKMVDPSRMMNILRKNNGGNINPHCFNGGLIARVSG